MGNVRPQTVSLGNYVGACANLSRELLESLKPEEVRAIQSALKGRKVIDWIRWRGDNEGLVADFVAATPRQRSTKKKFQEHRLYLTMAGAQLCLEAQALLRVVVNSNLTPGGTYREMAATAGLAFGDVFSSDIPYWPFSGAETPFVDDPGRDEDRADA